MDAYRDGVEVQVGPDATDDDVARAWGDELQVGGVIIELCAPAVNLDTSDDGVVRLLGVHTACHSGLLSQACNKRSNRLQDQGNETQHIPCSVQQQSKGTIEWT